MLYSLMRESRIVIEYEGRAYGFDALSNYNAGTSYEEFKTNRRTLHRRSNYAHSKITAQAPSSISLALNFSSNALEGIFFELMGFEKVGDTYLMPQFSLNIEPKMFSLYIINKNTSVRFDYCYATTCDFSLDKSVPVLNVGIESGYFEETSSPLNSYTLDQGEVVKFSLPQVSSNGRILPGLTNAGMSFQQQCDWRVDRSIFDINKVYNNKRAIVNELNSSALISMYYVKSLHMDPLNNITPDMGLPIQIRNKNIVVDFPSTRITKRLDFSDVYKIDYDVIPTEYSDPVTIKLLGDKQT